jgi:hypothetical protein
MSAGVPSFPDFSRITARAPNKNDIINDYLYNIYYLKPEEKSQLNFLGTKLVLISNKSLPFEPFVCFTYNAKEIGVHYVVEIYDFKKKNWERKNHQPTATQLLYNFWQRVKLLYTNSIIWLGTTEAKLYKTYTSIGFLPFTKPLPSGLPKGDPESLFSPLGISPGVPFWSFLFPDFEKNTTTQKLVKKNSRTSPIIIPASALRELSNFVPIRVSISGSAINKIYDTLVLKNKAESSLIFGISSGIRGSLRDIDCNWEKEYFVSSHLLNVSWHEMPAEHPEEGERVGLQIASSFGPTVLGKMPYMITGHTHPLFFYRPVGGVTESDETNQLISPPSLQDCKLIIGSKSPCHLVWGQECIYSLKFNHLLSDSPTENLIEQLEAIHAKYGSLLNNLLIRKGVIEIGDPIIDSILGMYGANRSTFASLSLSKQIGIRIKLYTTIFNKVYIDDKGYNILTLTPHFYTKLSNGTVTGFEPDLGNIFVKDVYNLFFTGGIDLGKAFANTHVLPHYIPVSKKLLEHATNICVGENCNKKPSLTFKGEATHYPASAAASAGSAPLYENNPGEAAGAGSRGHGSAAAAAAAAAAENAENAGAPGHGSAAAAAAAAENAENAENAGASASGSAAAAALHDTIRLNIVESKEKFKLPYHTYINGGLLSQLQREGREGEDQTYYYRAGVMYKPATPTYIEHIDTKEKRKLVSVKYEYIAEIKASLIIITTINPNRSDQIFLFNNNGLPISHEGDSLNKFIITTKSSAGGSRKKRKTYRRKIKNIKSKTKSKCKK